MDTLALNLPQTIARSDLSAAQRDEMFELLSRYFDDVSRGQFEDDLAEKNWTLLLRRDGRLVGFSTLQLYETEYAGEAVTVVYSGDTIVAPGAWGTSMLARAWIATVNHLRATAYPRGRCYWLLLTSGFRTYRFLPVFWREFHPRWDAATSPASRRLLDHLAAERFGARFDAAAGVVRFARPQRLRGPLAEVPAGREADLHVAFFLARNPGHGLGDELVCLTELAAANLTAAGRRMVEPPSNG